MIQPADFSVVAMPNDIPETWCVYEHHTVDPTGAKPGELIYIGSSLLRDVWNLTDARNNSEWIKIAAAGWAIMVRVVFTAANHREASTKAIAMCRSMAQQPRCNVLGRTLFGASRPLICSNGQEYANQTEAARLLGCSQSAISQHMRGVSRTVKGLTFAYKEVGQ